MTERSVYDAAFYEDLRAGAASSARRIVPLVLELIGGARSVIDLGCGSGTWLATFLDHGVEHVVGIEGATLDSSVLEVRPEVLQVQDLREPLVVDERFDLAVSVEVAEHLPQASAAGFVASLVKAAPVVLFSAAAPHQGGTSHVNEQWPDYWAAHFAEHGYIAVDGIRRRVWSDPQVSWWYAQNTLLFVAGDELDRRPRLRHEHDLMGTAQLSIVHPHRYLEWVAWGIEQNAAAWSR